MKHILKCNNCDCSFEANSKNAKYCSPKCKGLYLNRIECNKLEESGEENIDYIKCKWCGLAVTRVYGGHIKRYHPDKTSKDYREEFPNSLVATPSDTNKTHKNAGQHMKEDKYRKMASDAIKGDKNPMSKKNASEQKRKETSPFSIEFYRKRFPGKTDDEYKEMVSENVSGFLKDRLTWNQVEYWVNKGYSKEESELKISVLQNRGLEYLKNKYGEVDGLERWKNRTKLWKEKVFNDKQWIGGGMSKISNELFEILNRQIDYSPLYGSKEKFIRVKNTNINYKYDFTISENRKIIEFNGDYWHCNPNTKFGKDDYFHPIIKKNVEEIWNYDKEKIAVAESYGYKVKVVWEKDYRDDPKKVIKDCLSFIRD